MSEEKPLWADVLAVVEHCRNVPFLESLGVFIEATRLETGTLVATRVANTIALLSTASQEAVFIAATRVL